MNLEKNNAVVVLLVNLALDDNYISNGDINSDDSINVLDIVLLVNIICSSLFCVNFICSQVVFKRKHDDMMT